MKKKIFSSLLLVAAVVATSSVVFSCKDYDDEYAIEQRKMLDDLATLQDKVDLATDFLNDLKLGADPIFALWTKVDSQAIWDLTDTKLDSIHAFEVFAQKTDLNDSIQAVRDAIGEAIDALSETYVSQTNYNEFVQEYEQSKQDYQKSIDSLGTVIDEISSTINTTITTIVEADLDSIKKVTADLGEKIVKLDATVATVSATASTALTTAQNAQTKAQEALTAAQNAQTKADEAATAAANAATAAATAQTSADNAQKSADNAKTVADAAKALADTNKGLIENLQKVVDNKVDKSTFETLQTTVTNLSNTVTTLSDDVKKALTDAANAQSTANTAKATADANKTAIESIQSTLTTLATKESVTEVAQKVEDLTKRVEANETKIADILDNKLPALEQKIAAAEKAAKDYADELAKELGEKLAAKADTATVNALTITVGELKDNVDQLMKDVPALSQKVEELKKAVDELEPRVTALEQAVEKLVSKDDFNKYVSSVNINGTENPVIGYFNLPLDVRSMLLATYFGNADLVSDSRQFPTIRTNNAVFADRQFTDADDEMIGIEGADYQITINNKELLFNEEAGNAGKVYLTINPNTVDFTGLDGVSLVNSQNEESAFKLQNVKKSNEVMSYGYKMTRAGENNFYEADATLPKNKVSQTTIKVDIQNYKEIAQDIKAFVQDRSNRPDVANIARTVYTQISNVLPEQYVQVSWTDSQASRFVRSGSGLAATAVRPLSYSFYKDAHYYTVPGYERAINFIDRVIGSIKIDIPTIDVKPMIAPQVQEIEMVELSDEMIAKFIVKLDTVVFAGGQSIPFTLHGGTVDVVDNEGHKIGEAIVGDKPGEAIVPQQTLTIHYDLSQEIQKMYDDLQQPVADTREAIQEMVNALIDDVNEIIKQVNQLDNVRVSIEQAKKDIRDQLASYLTKINNLIVKGVNNANNALQPIMLIKTTSGFKIGSLSAKKAAKVNAESVLVLTSYTGEIVAPAYKKFVAVTNVYKNDGTLKTSAKGGDATCKSILNQANTGDLLKVLPGSRQAIKFQGKAGYIYEIAYAALDYSGRDTVRKFYVEVH